MSVFRTESPRRAGSGFIALLLAGTLTVATLAVCDAYAQGGAEGEGQPSPSPLPVPSVVEPAVGPPVRLAPVGEAAGVAGAGAGVGAAAGALTRAAPDGAGIGATGFEPGLWAGTPLPLVERLLAEIPVAAPSPTQRRLTLRLLMATAEPPAGDSSGYRLAALRVGKLAAMGATAEVIRLVAAIPGAFTEESLARHWVEVQLVQAPESLDCTEVARLAHGFGGPVWPLLVSACAVATHDTGVTGVPLALTVSSASGVAELILAPGALSAAMVAAIREPLRLAAVARAEAVDGDLRVAAAERAAAAGALSGAEVAAVYVGLRFAPAVLARPLSTTRDSGARGRALVYQALMGEAQLAVRAELLRHALSLLEPAQAVGAVAAVPLTVLAQMPVDATTQWLAPMAVQAFTVAGQPEAAGPWLSAASAVATARLWPLRALDSASGADGGSADGSSADGSSAGGGVGAWLRLALDGADTGRRLRLAGVLALLQAAGTPVSAEAWALVAEDGRAVKATLPSAALWQTLQTATAAHRVGEVVLAALVILGDGGPQALPPMVLAQIITSLSAVGRGEDARALAREAVAALLAG